MAERIQLPNGAFFPVKEGESKEQALAVAQQMYPDAFAAPVAAAPKGGSGLGDIARSFGLGAVGASGALASVFGADNAAARGLSEAGESLQAGMSSKRKAELQMQAERMKQAEASGSTWQEIKAGLLNVLEAPVQSAAQAVGSFAPMVATLPLAKVGLGARAIMAVRGAIGGAQGAGSVKQSVYEAVLRAEEADGKSPEQAQAAAARAQEYVGANLDQIVFGTGLGALAGSTGAEKLLPGGVRAQAGAAQQAMAKRLGERAATGLTTAAAEMPLEGIQGGQERLAANLALQRTGRDVGTFTGVAGQAAQEALTGGLGGGALGAALPDRTLSLAAAEERKKQQAEKAAAAEQQRLAKEQQAAADEAKRSSVPYAMQVGQQYDTLLADFKARKTALKAPGKDATPVEKAEYADAQKALKDLNEQLKEVVPEYRRTAPIRKQAQEQARVAGMDPFDYMMEQTGAVPTYTPSTPGTLPEVDMEGIPGAASDQPTRAAEASQALANYAAERIALAQEQLINPTSMELVDYLAQDPAMAARIVETKTPMPGMSRSESNLLRNALGKTLTAQTKAQEEARQARGLQGTAAGRQRISEVEAEEQEALEAQRAQTERDIAEARREQALGGEFAGLQRMGAAPAGISDQFGLFGEEQAPPAGSAAMGQMQQKLTGDDVTFTAEEEKARNLRRVPGAEFKLRGRNEGTAPVTREELADRLNAVLSTYDLSPEAVELLQRAEKALPQSGADYFALLDQQLAKIESGAEGVPRKGRERTLDLQTFPPAPEQQARASATAPTEAGERQIKQSASAVPGEAASGLKTPITQPEAEDRRTGVRGAADVTKRVTDTTPSTLRGPSTKPVPVRASTSRDNLTLVNELTPYIQKAEEAARVDTGQKSLFPEEQEKLGFIKGNRGAFQMFMKSKFVQNLRQQLRRDEEIAKRAQAIPALEKRANALVAEIEDILKQYAEYRSADEVIKANKDVTKAKRDMAEIRAAAGKATVDRMVLAGAIEDLKTARKQVIEQGYQEGGVQELIANIDAVNEQLQAAQTDVALLDSALSVLDGQLQSFAAVQKITALLDKAPSVERVEQAKQELQAVRAELDVLQGENKELQTRLRKDASDKRRADEAVKDAERRTLVAAGRIKPAEQALNNLPLYDKATQYPALTEAQLLAREKGGTLPDLTAGEKVAIGGDPARVLGGYRARITALEKTIQQSQDKSKAALARDMVEPKQKLRDALAKAYKQAKSATERDTIGPKLDVAEAELARAQAELSNTDVIWVGMKSQIKQLADVIAREEWLSGMISEGRIELEAPAAAKVRAKPTDAEREQASARRVEDASVRTTAATTSGDPLTRSQVAKARQPQKTQFEGKGVTGGTAKEIPMTPAERLAAMQARAQERLRKGLFRVSTVRGKGTTPERLQAIIEKMTADWKNVPTIVMAETYDALPDNIKAQAKADDVEGFIPGVYDSDTNVVYLVAENLPTDADIYATVAHEVAGHFGLRAMLGSDYAKTMDDIYAGNPAVRAQADAKMQRLQSLTQQTATEEVLADMAEQAPTPATRSALGKIINAIKNWFNKTFKGVKMSDEAVTQIVANAREYVVEGKGGRGGTAPTAAPSYRSKAAPATPALDALADKIITQPKTFKEKLGSNLALEAEMQGVDMRAGLRDVLKAGAAGMGDDKLFTQAMYNVLKADQKMPLIYTVMSNGPLETYRDDKGLIGVRSTNKNSAKDVYEAVAALPGNDAARKDRLATAYMVAQRAENKGLEKLDVGALGVQQSDLDAVLAEAKADPELRKGLEAVRTAYNAYNKGMIDFLATTGAIPKAVAKQLNEAGDYVPFYRVDSNGMAELVFSDDAMITIGDIRRQPYLAELKGGEQRILPLSEALPRNTILLTDKALTNMATKGVAYGLQSIGKGAGPVDPKTGKPTNKMPIQSGKGPADPRTIRFNQEPDPNDPKDTGERWLRVDTEGTLAEGVPSELLVKSLEGAHLPLPGFLKLAGRATDLLRAGVTRTPLYLARQLIREPMAAAFTGGLNYNAFTAVLKGGMKFVQMTRGNTDAEAKLLEKGLIQSGIFTGDVDDMGKFALQLAGNNQSALERLYAATDRAAIRADAATRSLVYENALANGLSEVEADFMTMESMNFYKRGLSPSVQYASRMIPFFNAQIQGLNVLYKAATGKMPFEEQQQIKRKFFNNAVLMMASGIVYAMAMEDDETWRNARPRDKMTNFFIPLPGTDELLKLPIPFEAGYFYSLAVAAVDGMREQTDNKEQWSAIKDLFINSIPGASSMGVPQLIKPLAEVWTNKNFMSGSEVESRRLQGLSTEERYNATTTELAKQMSKALPILSPIQIEHIVRGYFGVLPLAAAAAANGIFEGEGKGEKPEKRLSETALVGSAFQKKFGGADSDVVFRMAGDAMEARTTLNKMLNEGRRDDAIAYREKNRVELQSASAAGQYRQLVGRINADLRRTQERTDLTAAEKRVRIDKLDEAKQQAAQRFATMVRRIEGAGE
jgi:hypothetical protein